MCEAYQIDPHELATAPMLLVEYLKTSVTGCRRKQKYKIRISPHIVKHKTNVAINMCVVLRLKNLKNEPGCSRSVRTGRGGCSVVTALAPASAVPGPPATLATPVKQPQNVL